MLLSKQVKGKASGNRKDDSLVVLPAAKHLCGSESHLQLWLSPSFVYQRRACLELLPLEGWPRVH